jgi:hypothetical protein
MLTAIAPSQSNGNIIAQQKVAEISKPPLIPSLVLGERLNVLVLGDSHTGKILLQIKDSNLLAESPLPLKIGETLTVQVDQLHPILVLRTIATADHEISRTNEALMFYRSNPGALKEIVSSLRAFLKEGTDDQLSHFISKQEVRNLHNILKQIIISEDNIANPLFLKDYIAALGLTGERRLMKAVTNHTALKEKKEATTLKEILLKISNESTSVHTAPGNNEPDGFRIGQFSDLVGRAVTVIESLQIVNVLAQEQDGLFMLQIPVQFPDGIRMQEIFIEADGKNGNKGAEKKCRAVLFLNMDALGELAIDMDLKDATLSCTFKCQDQRVFDFLQPLLPALGHALSEFDYDVSSVQCVLDRDSRSWMQDFLQEHSSFTQNSIDVSI